MANQNSLGFIAKSRNPMYSVGKKTRTVQSTVNIVTATQANNDTVRLAGPLPFDARIARIMTKNASPALTAAVVNLGFMTMAADGTFVAITTGGATALWNASSGLATSQPVGDLLTRINAALDTTKNIGDILALTSDQEPVPGVFLVLAFPTKSSANGTIDFDIEIEEATTK